MTAIHNPPGQAPGSDDLLAGYDAQRVREAIRDNLWLHFTQMKEFADPETRPLMLVRGEGTTVWDHEGKSYLDFLAGIYSVNAGYGRARIVEAMTAQAEAMPFVNPFGYASVPAAVLADRLGISRPSVATRGSSSRPAAQKQSRAR